MAFGTFDFDFNTTESRSGFGDLIPKDTIAIVQPTIRRGGQGEGGWLTLNNDKDALYLDLEFTVVGGPFDKRKFWENWTVEVDEGVREGKRTAREISLGNLRNVIESARGISSKDASPAAAAARKIAGWGDLNGMRFCAKIGIKDGDNGYKDKNRLLAALTPDSRDYCAPGEAPQGPTAGFAQQVASQAAQPPLGAGTISKPSWAS